MSHLAHHPFSSPDHFNYTIITPQYSPDTTIAISLRHFEKESKAQAEREYDAEHGPMPEPPADDDDSIDIKERTIMKKKRKVRSAIVSRRKTAIYEKKLEDELQYRDNVNATFKANITLQHELLRSIRAKINTFQRTLDARTNVPKRMRTHIPSHPVHRLPQQEEIFFPDDGPVVDVFSSSAEQPRPVLAVTKQLSNVSDFTSECSDRQISPMLQPNPSPEQPSRDLSCGYPTEDSWMNSYAQNPQQPVGQILAASFAM